MYSSRFYQFGVLLLQRKTYLIENYLIQPFNDQYSHHIETSQLTGFYMMRTLVVKRLTKL